MGNRLTRVGLEKAAGKWIGSSWTREGSKIMDRLGLDSSILGGLKAGVSGDARYLGSVGRDLVILGG